VACSATGELGVGEDTTSVQGVGVLGNVSNFDVVLRYT
jgi:hypothetical protein